jgi:hypothetical protein
LHNSRQDGSAQAFLFLCDFAKKENFGKEKRARIRSRFASLANNAIARLAPRICESLGAKPPTFDNIIYAFTPGGAMFKSKGKHIKGIAGGRQNADA